MMTTISYELLALLLIALLLPDTNAIIASDGACRVLNYISYSNPEPFPFHNMYTNEILPPISYSLLAASELARQQFNTRDDSVVSEMAHLTANCSVYIPDQVLADGEMTRDATMKAILAELSINNDQPPCAVIGALPSGVNDALKYTTNSIEVPHLLYWQVHQHLVDRHSQNIISPIASPRNVADIMLDYLSNQLNMKGMAVVHENPDLSADLSEEFVNYGPKYNMQNYAFKRWSHDTQDDLDDIILDIKKYGLKTIFLNILSEEKTIGLAESLDKNGMLESDAGYLYILPTHFIKLDFIEKLYGEVVAGSTWDKLLSNSLVFDEHMDNFRVDEMNDRFLRAWKAQNSTFVRQMNAIHPIQDAKSEWYFQPEDDYFQANIPAYRAAMAYDAMMSIGLGACKAEAKEMTLVDDGMLTEETAPSSPGKQRVLKGAAPGKKRMLQPPPDGPPPGAPPKKPSNNKVHSAIVDLEFTGATDYVRYAFPGQRTKDSATIGIYNIRPVPSRSNTVVDGNGDSTHHSYEAVLSSAYNSGSWEAVPDTNFIYKDGSTTPPSGDLEVQEHNYLSSWVRALGFFFMGFTWLISLVCSVGIYVYRKKNAVRAGQPFFLQLICVSSVVMSTAILTLSFDEGSGWSNNSLNVACTLTPWFFILGQLLLISALFCKLWRINKVMQFRRRKVTIRAASTPIIVMLVIALVILISWTAVDPYIWQRSLVYVYPLETYGQCTCDNFWAWFGPLIALIVFSTIMVIIYAQKSLDISEEFADSRSILFAVFTQLQAWVVGIPILIVVSQTSADGTYLARVLLIWIFASSPFPILIIPKIYQAYKLQRNPDGRKTCRGNINTTGGHVVHTTGISTPNTINANSTKRSGSCEKVDEENKV